MITLALSNVSISVARTLMRRQAYPAEDIDTLLGYHIADAAKLAKQRTLELFRANGG